MNASFNKRFDYKTIDSTAVISEDEVRCPVWVTKQQVGGVNLISRKNITFKMIADSIFPQ